MISYKEKIVSKVEKEFVSVTCDICKKTFHAASGDFSVEDAVEVQEFHYIRFTGGYGSIFGDCSAIECDVCQHCLMSFIKGKYRED